MNKCNKFYKRKKYFVLSEGEIINTQIIDDLKP